MSESVGLIWPSPSPHKTEEVPGEMPVGTSGINVSADGESVLLKLKANFPVNASKQCMSPVSRICSSDNFFQLKLCFTPDSLPPGLPASQPSVCVPAIHLGPSILCPSLQP